MFSSFTNHIKFPQVVADDFGQEASRRTRSAEGHPPHLRGARRGCTCLLFFYHRTLTLPTNVLTQWIQNTYGTAIDTLEQVGNVVDSLYAKVRETVLACEVVLLTGFMCANL